MSVPTGFGSLVFFEECVSKTTVFRALSVGYELREWRYKQLASLMFEALPDFALNHAEKSNINVQNMMGKLAKAAKLVYATEKYGRRGEFGELLLHLIMRDYFNTIPAISKLYYKDGPNETVKGFDAVHVVVSSTGLELWVGETKFYQSIGDAIRDVVKELNRHTDKDYLRSEFLCIGNKIEDGWSHAEKLKLLLDERTSLDQVFDRMRIPVLLTYDSDVIKNHREANDIYRAAFCSEVNRHHVTFRASGLPQNVDVILILVPLEQKGRLVEVLHDKLEAAQTL